MAITQECCEQYWTSPGGNTPHGTNYMATCLPSRKLYKLDEPDMQDIAGEARTNSLVMYSYGPQHMAKQKQDDQLELTYSSYVRIQDVALKTCQKQWMIGRSGERGSGISVLMARHDDDDDSNATEEKVEEIRLSQPSIVLPTTLAGMKEMVWNNYRINKSSLPSWLEL